MRRRFGQISATWLIGGGLILTALAAGGIYFFKFWQTSVDVTTVVEGPVVQAFYATGTMSAQHEYSVRAATAGILRVKVDKGDNVKKGDVLAVVESSDLKFLVDQAAADLQRRKLLADTDTSPILMELRSKLTASQDMLDIAQKDADRITNLKAHGATSDADLDNAQNHVKTVWSDCESYKSQINAKKIDLDEDVTVAQAALDSAQWNLDQATIHSPIDGTVLDWPVSDGTRVAVNDHILQLADVRPDHLMMRAQVDEEDKNDLRPPTADGQRQIVKMTLYAYPNAIFTGTLDRIYDKADPDRRTYEVDVIFDKPDSRLAAGMTGELNFIVASRDKAIIVPAQAVQRGRVMVVRDGRLEEPEVKIGLKSIERVEITSGINVGDQVVISPIMDLTPGSSVRAHWVDPVAAAGVNSPEQATDDFKGFNH